MKYIIEKIFRKLIFGKEPSTNVRYGTKNPYGITIGSNSFLEKPFKIEGGKNIQIGNNSSIGSNAWLGTYEKYLDQYFNPLIEIGNSVKIGNYSCITSIRKISIEEGCLLSEYIYISDHFHGFDPSLNIEPAFQNLFSKGEIKIGKNSFIGYRATILSGVVLGNNCVVGAHSVVTKSFPSYSMIAGAPAKLIKRYDFVLNDWINIERNRQ